METGSGQPIPISLSVCILAFSPSERRFKERRRTGLVLPVAVLG